MKNALKSWKLWTILSALLFVMTFSLVVYAATTLNTSSPFTSRKTGTMWNTLTAENWDVLMDKLDYNSIPKWAVVAFGNTTTCPQWWSVYTPAINRYIRWWSASYYDNVEEIQNGGTLRTGDPLQVPAETVTRMVQDRVRLKVENLPPHSHSIFLWFRWHDWWEYKDQVTSVGFSKPWNRWFETTSVWATLDNYYSIKDDCRGYDQCKNSSFKNYVNTDKMYGSAFKIMDPYVYLLYCIKD